MGLECPRLAAPAGKPRVAALGLSIDIYRTSFSGHVERMRRQLDKFLGEIAPSAEVAASGVCLTSDDVARLVREAESCDVDSLLLIPLSYTPSLITVPTLLGSTLPVVIWNTQEELAVGGDYDFDACLMNHVTQGAQDLTNVLTRAGRCFGMESGHFQDKRALERLRQWLEAAKAARFAKGLRCGLLGRPFQGMGDFGFDESVMSTRWGPSIVRLSIGRLVQFVGQMDDGELSEMIARDRERFEVDGEVTDEIHRTSSRLELALRRLVTENRLDAFTMNFQDLVDDGRLPAMPFLGVNKLLAEGLGYAGEGDVMHAVHMAQARQLCGMANFTEMFTIDYQANRMLMTHMQECNSSLARKDRKIRLVRKDFWVPGMSPYVGMHFTLEPGPVTLCCVTTDPQRSFIYLAYETDIVDMPPLPRFDIPHWMIQLDEPVGEFLTRYSMAGGGHHLVAVPGHQADAFRKLAHLQGFAFSVV